MEIKYVSSHHPSSHPVICNKDNIVYISHNAFFDDLIQISNVLENQDDYVRVNVSTVTPRSCTNKIYTIRPHTVTCKDVEPYPWMLQCFRYANDYSLAKHPYNPLAHHLLPDPPYIGRYIWVINYDLMFLKVENKWVPLMSGILWEDILPEKALQEYLIYKQLVLEANPC